MRAATIAVNPALQVLDRVLVAQADRIIANSQFTAQAIQRIYNREADTIYRRHLLIKMSARKVL